MGKEVIEQGKSAGAVELQDVFNGKMILDGMQWLANEAKQGKAPGADDVANRIFGEVAFVTPPEQVFDPKRNYPAIPDDTATRVAAAVKEWNKTGGHVYNDATWTVRHGGAAYIGQYLYYEEGNSATGAIANLPPLRSGTESDLYDKICKYARSHDITDPKQKITQDQIMTWSLQVNQDADGNVCIQDAILTAHNVMRALARPEVVTQQNLPANDPIRRIIEDSTNQDVPGRPDGLPELMRKKYNIKGVNAESGQDLFDRNNPYSVFKPNADDRNSSTGSAYHFWVGALAASSLSSPVARGMVWGEGSVVKGNNKTGQDEKPWGGAGIDAWERM